LKTALAHLRNELTSARSSDRNDADGLERDHGAISVKLARESCRELRSELLAVRAELSAPVAKPSAGFVTQSYAIPDSLEAAGLQRRLGALQAAERENLCRLQEAGLQFRLNDEVNDALSLAAQFCRHRIWNVGAICHDR
jgi:hypothetical protein